MISLQEFSHGKRLKRRWRDYGTGLSKSSVAAAILEAVQSGILVHERRKSRRAGCVEPLWHQLGPGARVGAAAPQRPGASVQIADT